MDQTIQHAQEVKRRHEAEWLRQPNVVGVGIGYRTRAGRGTNEVCIVVSVKTKIPPSELKPAEILPASIEGVPLDVVATGPVRAL